MKLARRSIDAALLTWIFIAFCLIGGYWGYSNIGRLEDPAFTIKQAVVTTTYPGATADQMAIEVTEPLESAIQQMAELDTLTSTNMPGYSRISVSIDSSYPGSELPQLWDELRNKVEDATGKLPRGANTPQVNDGFGDVYGLFFAITAPGFSDAQQHDIANFLRRELLAVEGVADIVVAGLPEEAIIVQPDMSILSNLGISTDALVGQIQSATQVVSSGSVLNNGQRLALDMPEETDSLDALSELTVIVGDQLLHLTDIADVSRNRVEKPRQIIRYNGEPAFTLGIAGNASQNIVDIGRRVDAQLAVLESELPYGVELHPIYQQHKIVDRASTDFIKNLAASVAIVILVLAVAMGVRAAIVVGTTLLLTVVGTFFFMAIFSIEMERISLGALIIAMGMLVDNAIVVAEGMQIRMLAGRSSRDAADEATGRVQIPLLGATVIGIMAFSGIGLSQDSTGEFMFSLFAVVGISLLLSWILALTATPLLAHYCFKQGQSGESDQYSGGLFRGYARLLRGAIKARWLVVAGLIVTTGLCLAGFGKVDSQFFPFSDTPQFYVHYTLPQGTDIHQLEQELTVAESWLLEQPEVEAVSTFLGGGATRFMLTYAAHEPQTNYGHLIVRVDNNDNIAPLRARLTDFAEQDMGPGELRTERPTFGPNSGAAIEVRLSGRDATELRTLAAEVSQRMAAANPELINIRTDWREWEPVLVPNYAPDRARSAGLMRADVAEALLMATEGVNIAAFQEKDRQIPVVLRARQSDEPAQIMSQLIWSDASNGYLPVSQVLDGIQVEPRNTLIHRRDRLPTITVAADVPPGSNVAEARLRIQDDIEAITIPRGYSLEWGGEYESSQKAQSSLAQKLPLSFLIMLLISVLLFGALRQPLIIWSLIPMAINGVTLGLLMTGLPFSFTALLGLLSLSGMLIKNGIVLIEEIDLMRAEGLPLQQAIVDASTSRLRPVVLAAATTILGMAPLLTDPFFASMAVTIMGGLAFATVLTLVAAPVFYHLFFYRAKG
ncbi:efflux RND transporter permease subunit [Saccharospirillum mangrovi]|uniref:efflux RND transporter permease subunit n=1 Tax=Saccharospirillum mangrovi TaxID=2161747 RepID=UPI000D39FF13|nr:efflux RND transporter permease subunit [Saccharospirillum mangrovi]